MNKFYNLNINNYQEDLLKSASINNILKKEENNLIISTENKEESEKEKKKDTLSLNSFNSLNNNIFMNNLGDCLNNEIKNSYLNMKQKEINNTLFPIRRENSINDFRQNYINPIFQNVPSHSELNNSFQNYQPKNNKLFKDFQNFNQIFPSSNIIQNNLRKDLMPNNTNIINGNNINIKNFQIPFQNQPLNYLPQTIISANNIISAKFPNNFIIANNNIIPNINEKKSINNINNINCNKNKINLNNKNSIIHNTFNTNKIVQNINKNSNTLNISNSNDNKKNINLKPKENTINKNISPDLKIPNPSQKSHKILFSIKDSTKDKEGNLLAKKRKRFIQNNKLVFAQIDDDELNLKNEKVYEEGNSCELKKNIKPRGSRFRGVSKNGNQWQVLIMIKKKKRYLGTFSNEEEAARAYDKVALQFHGNKAKTNYDYTQEEMDKIMKEPKLLEI